MKKFLIAAVVVCGLAFSSLSVNAADEKKDAKAGSASSVSGVLIDNKCGAKKDEAAAAKHPPSCAAKEACAATGYRIVFGDKHLKLDDKGVELAKKYLEDAETTRVVVEGTVDGDTLKATSIKAAEEEKSGGKEEKTGSKEGKSEKTEKRTEKTEKKAEKSEK